MALGAGLGCLGVALGAFGSHLARPHLSEQAYATYQLGTFYHLIHALALCLAAGFAKPGSRPFGLACGLFAAGILFFSGALYVLSLGGLRSMGAVAPLGGLAFLAGWISLAVGAVQVGRSNESKPA